MAILLTGCAQFSDGSSVWQEGLWIIPTVTGLGALLFFYFAYRASRSNSTQQIPGRGKVDNTGNVPIYKTGFFVFSMILVLATIVIIFAVSGDK